MKRLDQVAGIPVVYALGCLRPPRADFDGGTVRRIGLLKTSAIGDTILLSGPAADLRRHFPAAEIILFAGASNREAAALIPSVDRVVELPVEHPLRAIPEIRRHPVDLLIDFASWPRINAVLACLSRARCRVGFRTPRQHRHYVYDRTVDHLGTRHEIENYRQLLRALGLASHHPAQLSIGQRRARGRHIVVHMFSGGSRARLKEWPEGAWVDVIAGLLSLRGHRIVLTGTADDRPRAARVRASLADDRRVVNAAGGLDLAATARLIASSAVTITVDTGILHLASAIGANLVALHGPTDPRRWGALNANAVSVFKRLECAPCLSLGFECRCRNPMCMRSITREDVLAAANSFF